MTLSLAQLAEQLGAELRGGDPEAQVGRVAPIETAASKKTKTNKKDRKSTV